MSTNRRAERHSLSALPANECTDQLDRPQRRRRTTSVGKITQFLQTGSMRDRSGSTNFQSALQDLSVTGKLASKIAESQKRGADSLARWAHNAQNAAIDDVMQQTSLLFSMFAERQQQFVREYTHSIQQLQKMADAERAVKDAEREVKALEDKEQKLKREIRRGISFFRHRRGGDVCIMRQQLEEVKTAKEVADRALSETRAEMEVVKMFRFRHGMQGLADAYRGLAQSCHAIFTCHREITELVPAVSNQDVRRMMYEGMPISRHRVEDLRRSLESGFNNSSNNHSMTPTSAPPLSTNRRRSEPLRTRQVQSANHYNTPPPPYTPTAPPEQSVTQSNQRHIVSDSHLLRFQYPAVQRPCTVTVSNQQNSSSSERSPSPQAQINERSSSEREQIGCCTHCGRMYPDLPPNPYKQLVDGNHDEVTA